MITEVAKRVSANDSVDTRPMSFEEEKSADEQTFEQYREALKQEATRLACFIRVYRLLQDRRSDRPQELNIAPAFFQTVIDALFSAIVPWIDKVFAEDSQRGLPQFS